MSPTGARSIPQGPSPVGWARGTVEAPPSLDLVSAVFGVGRSLRRQRPIGT